MYVYALYPKRLEDRTHMFEKNEQITNNIKPTDYKLTFMKLMIVQPSLCTELCESRTHTH